MNKTECLGTYRPIGAPRRSTGRVRQTGRGVAARGDRSVVGVVMEWCSRLALRHALKVLPDRMLVRMGMTRADAAMEAAKPFWMA